MSERCERTSERRSEWPSFLRVGFFRVLPIVGCGLDAGIVVGDDRRDLDGKAVYQLDSLPKYVSGRKFLCGSCSWLCVSPRSQIISRMLSFVDCEMARKKTECMVLTFLWQNVVGSFYKNRLENAVKVT